MGKKELRFARRVVMKVRQRKISEFVRVMKKSVFPRTGKCKGMRRLYLLHSVGRDKRSYVVLTLWDNRKAADGYGKSEAYKKNSDELLPLVESDPKLTEYKIDLHDSVVT